MFFCEGSRAYNSGFKVAGNTLPTHLSSKLMWKKTKLIQKLGDSSAFHGELILKGPDEFMFRILQ